MAGLKAGLTIALLQPLYLGEDQLHELIKKFFVGLRAFDRL